MGRIKLSHIVTWDQEKVYEFIVDINNNMIFGTRDEDDTIIEDIEFEDIYNIITDIFV